MSAAMTEPGEQGFCITLRASETEISPVVDQIMRLVREAHCVEGKEFEIEFALREALANAIKHGANGDPSKVVECCVSCEKPGIQIVVRDPGGGFDPRVVPDCCAGENIYSSHGRGIFLITRFMDEVHFEKNGAEIHMRKY